MSLFYSSIYSLCQKYIEWVRLFHLVRTSVVNHADWSSHRCGDVLCVCVYFCLKRLMITYISRHRYPPSAVFLLVQITSSNNNHRRCVYPWTIINHHQHQRKPFLFCNINPSSNSSGFTTIACSIIRSSLSLTVCILSPNFLITHFVFGAT